MFESDILLGALVCSRFSNLVNLLPSPLRMTSGNKSSHLFAAELLFDNFIKNSIDIAGIIGDKQSVEVYKKIFSSNNINTKLMMEQGVYKCIKPNKDYLNVKNMHLRLAEFHDINIVSR